MAEEHASKHINTDTTNFGGILSAATSTVHACLSALDDHTHLKDPTEAAVLSVDVGSATGTLTNALSADDGNVLKIEEEAAQPAIDLTFTFNSVTRFSRVYIKAYYAGTASHTVSIQLYNANTNWDTFNGIPDAGGDTMMNYSFFVPDATAYINGGVVKVRFCHTQSGSANHDLYIDVVKLI